MNDKVAHPVGLKCVNVRWLTEVEAEREGWDIRYNNTSVLEFSDGSIIYASCDPEGNDSGMLFGTLKNGDSFVVVPLEDM